MATVSDLQKLCAGGSRPQIVDVRSAPEFCAGHIPGAVNIPLDQLESRLGDLAADALLVLVCQRGTRAAMAATLLNGCRRSTVLEGGTSAWSDAGLPLVRSVKMRWALERQVRLIAGLLVLTGAVLALLVDPRCLLLSGIVGLGLTFAGLTDICLMASVLTRMPWNRASVSGRPKVVASCSM
ncbi:MAG TPA: rhodanese-like domain-containing protein [Terriglobales bacterium]|nr:rhodanese-like domain-containing protein [Terriglobales bacterium]